MDEVKRPERGMTVVINYCITALTKGVVQAGSNNTNSCVVIAGQLALAFQQIREEPSKRSILQTPIRTQSDSHHYSTQLLSYNIALKQPALRGLL